MTRYLVEQQGVMTGPSSCGRLRFVRENCRCRLKTASYCRNPTLSPRSHDSEYQGIFRFRGGMPMTDNDMNYVSSCSIKCWTMSGPCGVQVRLSDRDVERERSIVVEEWRQGRGCTQRASEEFFKLVVKDRYMPPLLPQTCGGLTPIEPSCHFHFYARWSMPGVFTTGGCSQGYGRRATSTRFCSPLYHGNRGTRARLISHGGP